MTAKEAIEQELKKICALKSYSAFSFAYIKITNKKGQQVPLKLNNVQQAVQAKIEELQSKGIPPRLIILKSRQMGASTGIQGNMIKETATKENRNGYIVSHEKESTSAIFQKAKYMYDYLPDDIKPLQKASNATELIFDRPTHYTGDRKGLHSKIEVKTAGNAGIGRSETRHYVHLSEFAFWDGKDADSPRNQLSGIQQAVPDEVDTWLIIESTANGMNEFYELWTDAVEGKNGLVPLFFPWYIHEEYSMELTEDEEDNFTSTLSEYERWLYNDLKLPLERVKWWRETKKNKCNNKIDQMKQENPTTPEEAFIFSGTPVFDVDTVRQRIEVLRKKYETNPPRRGKFTWQWNNPETLDYIKDDTIKFVDDKNGPITIYEDKKAGYPYVIGGDTKGEGHDKYAGTVINNITGNRAAVLHMQASNSKPYTWQMYCMGRHYNTALIGIEVNFNTAPIEELERLRYFKMYVREVYDKFDGSITKSYGWRTDGNTRPLIIDKEIHLIEEHPELFNDVEMLGECLTFVYDKNGRADAMSGKHDDILLSDMVGQEIRGQQSYTVEGQSKKTDNDEDDEDDRESGGYYD